WQLEMRPNGCGIADWARCAAPRIAEICRRNSKFRAEEFFTEIQKENLAFLCDSVVNPPVGVALGTRRAGFHRGTTMRKRARRRRRARRAWTRPARGGHGGPGGALFQQNFTMRNKT